MDIRRFAILQSKIELCSFFHKVKRYEYRFSDPIGTVKYMKLGHIQCDFDGNLFSLISHAAFSCLRVSLTTSFSPRNSDSPKEFSFPKGKWTNFPWTNWVVKLVLNYNKRSTLTKGRMCNDVCHHSRTHLYLSMNDTISGKFSRMPRK